MIDYLTAATRWNGMTGEQREEFLAPALREAYENLVQSRRRGVFAKLPSNLRFWVWGRLNGFYCPTCGRPH